MGRKSIDMSIVGKKFGKLTVVDFSHKDKLGMLHWLCECDCGNTVTVARNNLRSGHTTSCGCRRSEKPVESLINRRFGKLSVIKFDHKDESGRRYWLCECDCGKRTIVRRDCLLSGHTTSCGCYHAEIIDGLAIRGGLSSTRLYNIWCGLIGRCTREDHRHYRRYGGRGITVCEDWLDFEQFYTWAIENGYEPGLSIDRINNDDGYYPENCRWADQITQANNTSTNRYITWNGISHTIAEWARLLGVNYHAFYGRVTRGDMRDFETYYGELEDNRNDH